MLGIDTYELSVTPNIEYLTVTYRLVYKGQKYSVTVSSNQLMDYDEVTLLSKISRQLAVASNIPSEYIKEAIVTINNQNDSDKKYPVTFAIPKKLHIASVSSDEKFDDEWTSVGWKTYYKEFTADYNSQGFDIVEKFSVPFQAQHELASAAANLPGVMEKVAYPCLNCIFTGTEEFLMRVVIHLNDVEKWTREAIADWLESLDVDIRFKVGGEYE